MRKYFKSKKGFHLIERNWMKRSDFKSLLKKLKENFNLGQFDNLEES